MTLDKDKVNRILANIQELLRVEKPNLQELLKIREKFDQMVETNLQKLSSKPKDIESEKKNENWHKINID